MCVHVVCPECWCWRWSKTRSDVFRKISDWRRWHGINSNNMEPSLQRQEKGTIQAMEAQEFSVALVTSWKDMCLISFFPCLRWATTMMNGMMTGMMMTLSQVQATLMDQATLACQDQIAPINLSPAASVTSAIQVCNSPRVAISSSATLILLGLVCDMFKI